MAAACCAGAIGAVGGMGVGGAMGAVTGIVFGAAIGVVGGKGLAKGMVAATGISEGTGVRGPLGLSMVGEASQKPAGLSVLPPVCPATGVRGTVGATADDAGTVLKAFAN